jgi:hypothetical protein
LDDGASRDVLRVVRRGESPATLERRHLYYATREGRWKTGNLRGLTLEDLRVVLVHLEKVLAALSGA